MKDNVNYGTGRRKTAAARVFLSPGSGRITINRRPIDAYFGRETARMVVRQPLETIGMVNRFDIEVTVRRRRWQRPGRRHSSRHHESAAPLRRELPADASPRRLRHPGCARGRAQEGRFAQGPQEAAILEAVGSPPPRPGGSSNGRTADSDSASLGSNPSPPSQKKSGLVILLYKLMSRTGAGGSEKGSRRAVPVR